MLFASRFVCLGLDVIGSSLAGWTARGSFADSGRMAGTGRRRGDWRAVLAAIGLAAAYGCATPAPAADPAPPLPAVETRLYLIGDAGAPAPNDPVLKALSGQLEADPARSLVVFLGDNIYPAGLPPEGAPGRREAARRLNAQIDAVRDAGAQGVFVPGNHDWGAWGTAGWDTVKRQARHIAARGGPAVSMLPADGCPGPVVRDVGSRLRLVALDTQWWLHAYAKPVHPTSSCAEDSETEVVDALEAAIAGAGERRVVVVGHHPLASGGIHGGHFGWRDHIFPLRAKRKWLWIPLPVIGSAYPIARRRGVTDQDLSGALNIRMRTAIGGVFKDTPPVAYAAGHEHNLQVIRRKGAEYLLVSGTGFYGHTSRIAPDEDTLFARMASGYMRLDFSATGEVRLAVTVVDASGTPQEAFSKMLK